MTELWITCQPDNMASRRTLERLGAEDPLTYGLVAVEGSSSLRARDEL
ncbi:MAG: hypothetical protein ACREUL_03690 [Steroidobacteraceae bacterium]